MAEFIYVLLGFALGGSALALYFRPLKAEVSDYKKRLEKIESEKADADKAHISLREDMARAKAENESLQKQIKQRSEDEQVLLERFENLSNKIFESKGEKFRKQSQEELNVLLTPLKERIGEFQKKIDDSFSEQAKEQRSLKDQIKNIVELNHNMAQQAEDLTNALKGENKVQGSWGEYILEKILQDSGLQEGRDYVVQGTGLGLVDADGKSQKPDIVVNLPERRHLVIDSKLTLVSYERYFSETDESLRPVHLKTFTDAVRKRVEELARVAYQDNEKLGTPDFVLMFMPIEGAYALAMQQDSGLHEHAWRQRIVIVCPTTLFATMKTVASIWRLERQNRNAQEIAKQGGALYDKVYGFVADMAKIGHHLEKLDGVYEDAMKKLSKGQGNIIGKVEKLKELGAKTTKSLPTELLEDEDESSPTALINEAKDDLDRETGT